MPAYHCLLGRPSVDGSAAPGAPPVGCPIFADGGAVGQTAAEGMFVVVGSHSERGNKTTTTTTTATTLTTL